MQNLPARALRLSPGTIDMPTLNLLARNRAYQFQSWKGRCVLLLVRISRQGQFGAV